MACVARTHTAIIMRVLYMLYCTIALYYGTSLRGTSIEEVK